MHFRDTRVIPYVARTAKPILVHSYRSAPAALANPSAARTPVLFSLHG